MHTFLSTPESSHTDFRHTHSVRLLLVVYFMLYTIFKDHSVPTLLLVIFIAE
jgi:hypothetical protein